MALNWHPLLGIERSCSLVLRSNFHLVRVLGRAASSNSDRCGGTQPFLLILSLSAASILNSLGDTRIVMRPLSCKIYSIILGNTRL